MVLGGCRSFLLLVTTGVVYAVHIFCLFLTCPEKHVNY